MDSLVVIAACVCMVLAILYLWRKSPKNLPPGPLGLPFIGNSLSFGTQPHVTMTNWKEKYGDTYRIYGGRRLMIILNNFDTVRKVFSDDATTGRLEHTPIRCNDQTGMGRGLIHSQGDIWKTHRRFALSTLRDLGMGKNWLEETILTEVEGICWLLRETNQKPFDPKAHLTNSISNVICALIFGQRFSLTDPKFTQLTGLIAGYLNSKAVEGVAEALPFLMWYPSSVRRRVLSARATLGTIFEFLKQRVREHANNRSGQTEVQDYLYAYQDEKQKGLKTSQQGSFDDHQLVVSLNDLFIAGTETTSTTTIWGFLFMIENPDIMKKVQEEIDLNVGRERLLTNADRGSLPYTEAVILEIQRCASLVPLAVPHINREEIQIDGYTIPKDTVLIANLFSIHHDPRYWQNPEVFDPQRFLGPDGRLIRPEGFAPFSIGKRVCLGEALAKMELFLFIANLLRCFSLKLPAGKSLSREDYFSSVVNCPHPFELIFVPRV